MPSIEPIDRDSVMMLLARATIEGQLGLFVGTGFSIAITRGVALTFRKLLDEVNKRLKIGADLDGDGRFRHKSLSQVASLLLKDYLLLLDEPDRPVGGTRFRESIGDICNLMPNASLLDQCTEVLDLIKPSWVITTNYDLLIEAIIPSSQSYLTDQPLVPNQGRVPVYHLHGHRFRPDSIRITEEDYIPLLSPQDYQRLRLPLLLLESTTLMIGYSLGDINVRSAMNWARSLSRDSLRLGPDQGKVVQALYRKDSANIQPYDGPNGETVIEITDLLEFMNELGDKVERTRLSVKKAQKEIKKFLLDDSVRDSVLMGGSQDRELFLGLIKTSQDIIEPRFIVESIEKILDPIWEKAHESGGWRYYALYLNFLLDVLVSIDFERTHPSVLGFLGGLLDRVAGYFGLGFGDAHDATRVWERRQSELGVKKLNELRSLAQSQNWYGLKKTFGIPYDT